jgi:polysaccharide biosynthesis transport protein
MLMERERLAPSHELVLDDDAILGRKSGGLSFDFREIWAAIYRRRLAVTAITLGCIVIGIVATFLKTPIYRARATIQIDQEAAKVLGTEQTELSASIQDAQRFLNTQLDILQSRAVAQAVADELRLFDNAQFLEDIGYDPELARTGNADAEKRDAVLVSMSENLSVSLPRDSRVATVQFDNPNADLAARITNSYVANFIRGNLQRRFDTTAYAREFLRDQLRQAQARLERSERAAVDFATRTRIIDPRMSADTESGTPPSSLQTATLVQLNREQANAMAKRISAERRWAAARATPLMNLPEVLANPAVQELIEQRAQTRADYEQELSRHRSDYPTVRQLRARLSEIDAQVRTLANSIRDSVKADYDTALAQERGVRQQVENLKGVTLREQRTGIQLNILRREAETNRAQFDSLLRRYNQLEAESGVQSNNIAVVDRATAPLVPAWPKIPLNIAVAVLAGLALSAAYIFIGEHVFGRIRTPDDVSSRLGYPLLGAVPLASDSVGQELRDPKSGISEAFNSIRTALYLSTNSGLPRSLAFISAQKGEGKSSACYASAIAMGRAGARVVIVDLDLRLPNQHKLFGVSNDRGVSDILTNNATVDDVVSATDEKGVSLVTSGSIPPSPTELLASDKLKQMLGDLSSRYDVVVIDSPPVLGLADAVIISSLAQAVVFVVQSGRNAPRVVSGALGRLRQAGANVVGVLLQRFDPVTSGYSYGGTNYQYKYSS